MSRPTIEDTPGGGRVYRCQRPTGDNCHLRLFAALEGYARRQPIPLSAALRQLRDEVHRAP